MICGKLSGLRNLSRYPQYLVLADLVHTATSTCSTEIDPVGEIKAKLVRLILSLLSAQQPNQVCKHRKIDEQET
jgi:hypothetical protein